MQVLYTFYFLDSIIFCLHVFFLDSYSILRIKDNKLFFFIDFPNFYFLFWIISLFSM